MTRPKISIQRAEGEAIGQVRAVLAANDLPTEDVSTETGHYVLATADSSLVGVAGFEQYGSDALLRSVVVTDGNRGSGYGTALCGAVLDRARAAGVETVYLLTTDAASFFEGQGFEPIRRTAVPSTIEQTAQFSTLCPESTSCLRRRLD